MIPGQPPDLPRAACAGRWEIYDLALDDDRRAEEIALSTCRRCLELEACGRWFESLPQRRRPYGVIAGRIRRPRKKAA